MSFNFNNSTFISFALYADVTERDQTLFQANEDLTESVVNGMLAKASQRILSQIKNDDWWQEYQFKRNTSLSNDPRQLPDVDPAKIKRREQEFKDLNIYFALSEYLLPRVADFGIETSAEVAKIKFYKDQYNTLFKEIIQSGDFYDFSGDGTVSTTERMPVKINLVRSR
jgi:hypothetical protein